MRPVIVTWAIEEIREIFPLAWLKATLVPTQP